MSCLPGNCLPAINCCCPTKCDKEQLACFNLCYSVQGPCDGSPNNAFSDPTPNLFGAVIFRNTSSNCRLTIGIIDAAGAAVQQPPPGQGGIRIVKDLNTIDYNWTGAGFVGTAEIELQLLEKSKIKC